MSPLIEELHLFLRFLLAVGLSAVIGIEREFHGRPAGLRTHLLVGSGAALLVIVGQIVAGALTRGGAEAGVRFDQGRIIAGVITGVGFLGAGTIIRQGDWVRGLTTAASVWFVAGVGVAAGQGLYVIAAGAAITGFLVLFALSRIGESLPSLTRRVLTLEVAPGEKEKAWKRIRQHCRAHHMKTRLLSWESQRDRGVVLVRLQVSYWKPVDIVAFADGLGSVSGAKDIRVEV